MYNGEENMKLVKCFYIFDDENFDLHKSALEDLFDNSKAVYIKSLGIQSLMEISDIDNTTQMLDNTQTYSKNEDEITIL